MIGAYDGSCSVGVLYLGVRAGSVPRCILRAVLRSEHDVLNDGSCKLCGRARICCGVPLAIVTIFALLILAPSRALAITYTGGPYSNAQHAALGYLGYEQDDLPSDVVTWLSYSTRDGGNGTEDLPNYADFARFKYSLHHTATDVTQWYSDFDGYMLVSVADAARADVRSALLYYGAWQASHSAGNASSGSASFSDGYVFLPATSTGYIASDGLTNIDKFRISEVTYNSLTNYAKQNDCVVIFAVAYNGGCMMRVQPKDTYIMSDVDGLYPDGTRGRKSCFKWLDTNGRKMVNYELRRFPLDETNTTYLFGGADVTNPSVQNNIAVEHGTYPICYVCYIYNDNIIDMNNGNTDPTEWPDSPTIDTGWGNDDLPEPPDAPEPPQHTEPVGTSADNDIQALLDALYNHCLHLQDAIYDHGLYMRDLSEYLAGFLDLSGIEYWLMRIHEVVSDAGSDLDEILSALTNLQDFDTGVPLIRGYLKGIYDELNNWPAYPTMPTIPDPVSTDVSNIEDKLDEIIKQLKSDGRITDKPTVGEDDDPIGVQIADKMNEVKDRFPFSIPWDVMYILGLLRAEPVAPSFDLPVFGSDEEVHVDLSSWEPVAVVTRSGTLLLFGLGLALRSRSLIHSWGGSGD